MSCSLFTSWLYSLNFLSCEDAICSTSNLCSLRCVSNGISIYGIFVVYLTTCTIVDTGVTTVGTANGSTLPLIIIYALKYVLSCSLFILEFEAPPSSTLFFLLRTILGEFAETFFLFSSAAYISSLVLLTLVGNFCGFTFWCTNIYWMIFANTNVDWHVSFLSPLFSLTYLYHLSSSLHKLLNIMCAQSTLCPFYVFINVMASCC